MYSWQDVRQIRLILYLTRDLGVNLAGVDIILGTQRKIDALQQDIEMLRQGIIEALHHRCTAPLQPQALVKRGSRTLVKVQPKNPK